MEIVIKKQIHWHCLQSAQYWSSHFRITSMLRNYLQCHAISPSDRPFAKGMDLLICNTQSGVRRQWQQFPSCHLVTNESICIKLQTVSFYSVEPNKLLKTVKKCLYYDNCFFLVSWCKVRKLILCCLFLVYIFFAVKFVQKPWLHVQCMY